MNKIYTFYSLLACLVLSIGTANAYTFTWNGSASSVWSNATNWTRTGSGSGNTIPGSGDDVVFSNGSVSNQPILAGNVTVNNLTMSVGLLKIQGYTFTILNSATFTGGTVENGWIDANNFVDVRNTTFDAGGNSIVLNKTNLSGSSNNDLFGNNTFKGPFAAVNSSSARFRFASNTRDIYQGYMHYEERGSGALEPAYNGNNIYPAEISTQGSPSNVSFANGSTGRVIITGFTTLYGNRSIINRLVINTNQTYNVTAAQTVNSLRLLNGTIDLNDNTITVTDASILGGLITDGVFQFTDLDTFQNSTLTDLSFIKLSGGGENTVRGGNTFTGTVIVRNNDNDDLRLANVAGDDYNGAVQFLEMGSGDLEPARNGNNTFAGNISTVGSTNVVTFGASNGWVIIDGNSSQSIAGDFSRQPIFNRLRMNTNGSFTSGGVPININNQLDLTKGYINSTSSFYVHLMNSSTTVVNTSNISHVVGPVRKTGTGAFTFPVGNGVYYAPISISSPGNAAHYFTASYTGNAHPDLSVSGLDHISTEEYWILDRNPGTASNVRVTLSYNFDRSGPINKRSDLRVARYNGADWVSEGLFDTTGTPGNGTITSNIVTNFSPFTLGSSSGLNPLPITLLSFNATPVNASVIVKWITTNEQNNDFFTVEKSLDGRTWLEIGVVDGAENSNLTLDYELIDRNPVEGLQFYRLKQTDLNGEYSYSSIVPVKFNSELKTLIYPQPASNIVNVSLQNNENQNVSITVYSSMGQKLIEMNQLNGNNFQVDISQLNTGVYYMEVSLEGVVSKMKLIKQ